MLERICWTLLSFLTSTRTALQATDVRRNVCCQSLQPLSLHAALRNVVRRPLHWHTPGNCVLRYAAGAVQLPACLRRGRRPDSRCSF
jgi:hypothetical protein